MEYEVVIYLVNNISRYLPGVLCGTCYATSRTGLWKEVRLPLDKKYDTKRKDLIVKKKKKVEW